MNTVHSVWKKVERRGQDECWPWIGNWFADAGYGRMDVMGVKGVYAHRVAFLAANPGSIQLRSDRLQMVLHRCDNPKCCNPKHLFLGNNSDNMQDRSRKGRNPDYQGERSPNAKLSNEHALEIRRLTFYGISSGELANLFNVSKGCVKGITSGRHFEAVR